MSDEITPTTQAVDTTAQSVAASVDKSVTQPAVEVWDEERARKTIENLRAIEKQAKKDAKELEELRAKEKQRADAELTELERFKKQASEAETRMAQLQLDLLKRDVISEIGLPAVLADRLKGTTKEELLADARILLEVIPQPITPTKTAPALKVTNPSNAQTVETEAQKRERLFGRQANIFDANAIRERGGGVRWSNQPE